MKWTELLRKDNYALLQSESDTQYAVVSGYDPTQPEDQQWAHGTYFTYWNNAKRKAYCLQNALNCFRSKTEEHYVTKGQKTLKFTGKIIAKAHSTKLLHRLELIMTELEMHLVVTAL